MEQKTIQGPHGALAYRQSKGDGHGDVAGVVWLGGFRSDMTGSKATALHDWAEKNGVGYLRFDYSGHGASAGQFDQGAVSEWLADAKFAIESLTEGPQILVGSSMGAWIATHIALARPTLTKAIVFIAPALDFTSALMWPSFTKQQQDELEESGLLRLPSEYGEDLIITKKLIDDGARLSLLDRPIPVSCPVRILQGMRDPDVPWRHAIRVLDSISGEDVAMSLTKSGDHRLSTDEDIARLITTVEALQS